MEVAEAAVAFRRLVLLVGAQVLLGLGSRLLNYALLRTSPGGQLVNAVITFLLVVGLAVAQVVTAYRLATRIGETPAWAVAAVMCIPCINVLMLLHLSSRASAWCRQHGVPVGLLGPSATTIAKLESGSPPRGGGLGLHG